MTMLGGVPIRVIMPPRMVAKDSAISVSEGLRFARAAAFRSTGISRVRAATLFITADSAAEKPAMMAICVDSLRELSTMWRATMSMAPELDRPRLAMSTSAMMTVAGWPKPEKA